MKTLYHLNLVKSSFGPFLTPRGLDWTIRGNFNTDFYGSIGWMMKLKKVTPLNFISDHWYKRIDHMDEMYDFTKVSIAWNELRRRIAECADDSLYMPKQVKKMFITLGRATHSMSDIYSHSNYLELLFDYYRNDPEAAEKFKSSGLPLADFIGEHAPTFSEIIESPDRHSSLINKWIKPKLFTDQAIPDEGPRSHDEINKDYPRSKRSNSPEFPGIFNALMAMDERDMTNVVRRFFEELREKNFLKFTLLTTAMPGAMSGPGKFERRAHFWASKFDAWE